MNDETPSRGAATTNPNPTGAGAARPLVVALAVLLALAQPAAAQTSTAAPPAGTTSAGAAAEGAAPAFNPVPGQAGKDVVWVPTPQALVDRMLDMAGLTTDDYVVDLGSGDGRTVITAARRGARAHGIEYNPDMVALARRNAEAERLSGRATFEQGDIFKSDFSTATLVTLFLLPGLNLKLRPILLDMKPGTRVVSNSFNMDDWAPDDTIDAGSQCVSYCRAFKWVIPAKAGGTWTFGDGRLTLEQTYQMLEGELTLGGKRQAITGGRLDGTAIQFSAAGRKYSGRVDGNRMSGSADDGSRWSASREGG